MSSASPEKKKEIANKISTLSETIAKVPGGDAYAQKLDSLVATVQ